MQQAAKAPDQERRLTLTEVIDWLVEDVMIDAASADKLRKERRYYRGTSHPLVIIADQKWKSVLRARLPRNDVTSEEAASSVPARVCRFSSTPDCSSIARTAST